MRSNDQSTWRYTADDGVVIGENLPLQILRVILGWRIQNPATGVMKLATGAGVPGRRISFPSFQVAANLADELVNRAAGGNEPRYHGAGVVSEGDDQKTVLDMLCSACCGRFRDTGGKLALAISHNDLAAVAVDDGLNDDDVVGAFTWDPDPSLEATPNVVRGRYVDATSASLYQLIDYPEVRLPSPDGQDRFLTLDLGVVESPSHAQRVAKQVLQRRQYSRQFAAPFDIRAWKYTVGDVLPFNFAPLGFKRGVFRVKEQELGQGGTCNMVLTYETPAFYLWDADDSLPVKGAEPIVYDSRNNPLILAIDEAATTAFWDGVTGPNKPDDNATNSADPNSPFGSGTVSEFELAVAAAREQLAIIDGTTIPTINQTVAAGRQAAADALADAVGLLTSSDAKLSTRIDSLVADGGYDDTAVYAEVRRVDQAAISRDGTIAQNISSVITSYQNADTITNARVEQVATSASNATQAVADLATSVNTRFSGVNTTLSSYDGRITTLATTVQGFAGRTDTLESQLNGSANSNLLARATNEATAAVDVKVGAVAQSVTTLSAQVLKVGVNFLPNSSGENGGVNTGAAFQWTAGAGPWFTAFSSSWGQVMQNNAPTTNVITIDSPRVACTPNTDYTAAADLLLISDLAGARCYVDHVFERADGTLFYANNGRPVFGSRDFGSIGFRDAVWATARAPADAVKVFMRGVFTSDQAGSHSNIGLRQAKLEAGSGPYTAYSQEGTVGQNAASLTQQAGVLAGIDGRTSVYWSVTGSTGDGSTRIQLSKASGQTGLFYVEANMYLRGNLVLEGTLTSLSFDRSTMSRESKSVWQGSITPGAGQTITVPWSLALSPVQPLGRFIYEFTAAVSSNAGQQVVGQQNGKPSYLTYIEDNGGLSVSAADNQGNVYRPRANGSDAVLAVTSFSPNFVATIRTGGYDTGWINNGDSYERQVAASYTVSRIDLKVTWVAI